MSYPARKHVEKTFEKLLPLLPSSDRSKPQVLLLAGSITPYRNDTDRELSFRQESNFLYLSGCEVPSSYILITLLPATTPDLTHDNVNIQLFIPPIQPPDLMWSIPPPTIDEAHRLLEHSGITSIKHSSELVDELKKASSTNGVIVHILPHEERLFPTIPQDILDLSTHTAGKAGSNAAGFRISDEYLLPSLHLARLIKTPEEIERIRHANAISSRAHEVVMRVLGAGVRAGATSKGSSGEKPTSLKPLLPGEWLIEKESEAEAIFVASCRREGSIHQAYLPIVASSTRASTLHYCCNDRAFAWGPVGARDHCNDGELADGSNTREGLEPQVLLIDAGCEWKCYASDITRTMPVGNGGKFSKEAGEIYELVLEMQKASFDILKPGLHWDMIQHICHLTLIKGFLRLGIFRSPNSSPEQSLSVLLKSGVSSAFFPHGVGHSLGMDVHDVPSASKPLTNTTLGTKGWAESAGDDAHESFYSYLRLRLSLEAGMVVTVEPGIYFHPHLLTAIRSSPFVDHEVLKRYEGVGGVRIEDVVVILDGKGEGGELYENLTTVRSERAWVEGVCSGVL